MRSSLSDEGLCRLKSHSRFLLNQLNPKSFSLRGSLLVIHFYISSCETKEGSSMGRNLYESNVACKECRVDCRETRREKIERMLFQPCPPSELLVCTNLVGGKGGMHLYWINMVWCYFSSSTTCVYNHTRSLVGFNQNHLYWLEKPDTLFVHRTTIPSQWK